MRKVYLLITAAMLLIGSSTLWAAGHASPQEVGDVAKIQYKGVTTFYSNVAEALADWKTSDKNTEVFVKELTLLADCEYTPTSQYSMSVGTNNAKTHHKLDLAGHTLTWKMSNSQLSTTNQTAWQISSKTNLTVVDGSEDKTGGISFEGYTSKIFYGINPNYNNTVTVAFEGGTFVASNPNGTSYVLYMNNPISGDVINTTISNDTKIIGGVSSPSSQKQFLNGGLYYPCPAVKYAATGYVYNETSIPVGTTENKFYELISSQPGYIAAVDGVGYTSTDAIWALDKDITVQILQSSAENPFEIPSTFNHTVTVALDNNLFIENSGNMKFAQSTSTSGTNIGYLNLKNSGTVVFDDEGYSRKFNYPVINNSGAITIAPINSFVINETLGSFSGNGQFTILANCKFPALVYNQLLNLNVELPDGSKWCKNGSDYQVCLDKDIVAKVGVGANIVYYSLLETALNESSIETPAILYEGHDGDIKYSSSTSQTKDIVIEMNGKNIDATYYKFKQTKNLLKITNSKTTGGLIYTSQNSNNSAIEINGRDSEDGTTGLYLGKNVTLENRGTGYGVAIFNKTSGNKKCYGVTLDIEGSIHANGCITINGNAIEGTPVINIADGAILKGYGEDACPNEACIYAGGYGIWNIDAATLKANTPIYAKAGIININGADIEACGAFSEPVEYGNGFYPTGDAIILDTHKSYAGDMILNIVNDDTEIKSTHGYAIHEAMTKAPASDASSAIGLTIQGTALLQGGDVEDPNNATKFTERFTQALIDGSDGQYQWVMNGVSGGRYTSKPSVVAPGYEAEFNTTTGYWEVHLQSTPAPSRVYTIIENTEWPSTELADNSEVLIKTGATLTVPSVSVEDGSVITVEPGAKLVAGANGITTESTSGLVLKADKAHGTGMVLFDGTTSNKQPQGTVELYLVAKKIDDYNYVWQHFGIPTTSAPTITRLEPVSYKDWDVKKGWIYTSGSAALTAPWVGHNVTTAATAEGNIISFAGTLVGMTDASLNLSQTGYNCLSNSFTAPISVKSFVGSIDPTLTTDGMVWIYDPETDNFIQKNKASFILNPTDVFMPSMQGFFLLNSGSSPIEVSLPYSNVETTAGLKDAPAYNGGIISLSNGVATSTLQILEGDEFSDEFESTFDGYQMPTDNIQIYAIQGTDKLSSIATNNIDGKEIEIVTKAGTEYSLSFSNLMGNAFKLKDLLTGEDIEVSEDNVYRFTAEPNSTLRRFKIGEGEVSAEEADANAVKIWANDDAIFVANNAAEANIEIINLSGVVVATAAATGEAVQAVPVAGLASGVYVVRVGTATAKVVK